jgi:hypothetical protein
MLKQLLNEQITQLDIMRGIKELYEFASRQLDIDDKPALYLVQDEKNADDLFGKTGYYDPKERSIHLFVTNRHPKDVLRSFAHELVHHEQNLRGKTSEVDMSKTKQVDYAAHDPVLREMERDAFERGNMIFRDWTDMKKKQRREQKGDGLMESKKKYDLNKLNVDAIVKLIIGPELTVKDAMSNIADKEKRSKVMKKIAQLNASDDHKHQTGLDKKDLKDDIEEDATYGDPERVEALMENDTNKNPHPELFIEKERLMKDFFQEKEKRIFDELMKRLGNKPEGK